MIALLMALTLGAAPFLGEVTARRQPDGTWKCFAACHVSGNRDAGYCHEPTSAKGQPSRDACKADLERQCAVMKPPPGGCYVRREAGR